MKQFYIEFANVLLEDLHGDTITVHEYQAEIYDYFLKVSLVNHISPHIPKKKEDRQKLYEKNKEKMDKQIVNAKKYSKQAANSLKRKIKTALKEIMSFRKEYEKQKDNPKEKFWQLFKKLQRNEIESLYKDSDYQIKIWQDILKASNKELEKAIIDESYIKGKTGDYHPLTKKILHGVLKEMLG